MEKTAYHSWLYREGQANPVIIADLICNNYLQDNNPQAAKLIEATGDEKYTAGTFYRAAYLVIELCEPNANVHPIFKPMLNFFQ